MHCSADSTLSNLWEDIKRAAEEKESRQRLTEQTRSHYFGNDDMSISSFDQSGHKRTYDGRSLTCLVEVRTLTTPPNSLVMA